MKTSDLPAATRDAVGVPSGDTRTALLTNVRTTAATNPARTAAGAVAAGLLIGLALPQSDAERERLAPLAERFVENAKSAARSLFEETLTRTLGTGT